MPRLFSSSIFQIPNITRDCQSKTKKTECSLKDLIYLCTHISYSIPVWLKTGGINLSYHHVIQTQASKTVIKILLYNLGNVNLPVVHWKGTLGYKGRKQKEQMHYYLESIPPPKTDQQLLFSRVSISQNFIHNKTEVILSHSFKKCHFFKVFFLSFLKCMP